MPNFRDAAEQGPEGRSPEQAGCTCSPKPRQTIKNKPGFPCPPHPAPDGSYQGGRLRPEVHGQSPSGRRGGLRPWHLGVHTKDGGERGAARGGRAWHLPTEPEEPLRLGAAGVEGGAAGAGAGGVHAGSA